jgi:hypothetical protein
MAATPIASQPATSATPLIDFAVFDAKAAEHGATNESARAQLADVDRTTLWRWRTGRQTPGLEVSSRVADRLGISLDELTGRTR